MMDIHSGLMVIATSQFDAMVSFYQRLLQQDPDPFQPARYAEFQLPSLCLALFPPKPEQHHEFGLSTTALSAGSPETTASQAIPETEPRRTAPLSLCLKVTDLDAVMASLQTWDCPMGEVAIASHGKEVYVYDPQGNRIILYQPNQQPSQ